MFGLDLWEFLIILVVALIVVGPKRLPEVARTLGKTMRELRRASNDLRHSLDEAMAEPPPPPPPKVVPPSPTPQAIAPTSSPKDPYRDPDDAPTGPGPERKDG
jgi:sec-independent protein translocase protein TatB